MSQSPLYPKMPVFANISWFDFSESCCLARRVVGLKQKSEWIENGVNASQTLEMFCEEIDAQVTKGLKWNTKLVACKTTSITFSTFSKYACTTYLSVLFLWILLLQVYFCVTIGSNDTNASNYYQCQVGRFSAVEKMTKRKLILLLEIFHWIIIKDWMSFLYKWKVGWHFYRISFILVLLFL